MPFKLYSVRDPVNFMKMVLFERFNSKKYLIPKSIEIPKDSSFAKIFKKRKYNLELINELNEEVEKSYIRANHQIEFNNSLPYSCNTYFK